jgi:hypothetical protein
VEKHYSSQSIEATFNRGLTKYIILADFSFIQFLKALRSNSDRDAAEESGHRPKRHNALSDTVIRRVDRKSHRIKGLIKHILLPDCFLPFPKVLQGIHGDQKMTEGKGGYPARRFRDIGS